eukprot:6173167-Pleurochrysis_carterae.AAC.1
MAWHQPGDGGSGPSFNSYLILVLLNVNQTPVSSPKSRASTAWRSGLPLGVTSTTYSRYTRMMGRDLCMKSSSTLSPAAGTLKTKDPFRTFSTLTSPLPTRTLRLRNRDTSHIS